MVATIETLKSQHAVASATLAATAALSVSSCKRWKYRISCGQQPVRKPGIKKMMPFDLENLRAQINTLNHGKKRSAGTVRLYHLNRHSISRRDFNEMVRQVHQAINRSKQASFCRVSWLKANLAWAYDGMQYTTCHIHNLQDLCSRYKFVPLTTEHMPCGEQIVVHLECRFDRFGPPLFIKRDNGPNLNQASVNRMLGQMMIIPINSPDYTAAYNGAIEHCQGEMKIWIGRRKAFAKGTGQLALLVGNAAHALNHRRRRSLSGKNVCQVYYSNRLNYSKRERKQAYEWIRDLAFELSVKSGKSQIDPAALRICARRWMEKHNLIRIPRPEKLLANDLSKTALSTY